MRVRLHDRYLFLAFDMSKSIADAVSAMRYRNGKRCSPLMGALCLVQWVLKAAGPYYQGPRDHQAHQLRTGFAAGDHCQLCTGFLPLSSGCRQVLGDRAVEFVTTRRKDRPSIKQEDHKLEVSSHTCSIQRCTVWAALGIDICASIKYCLEYL